jgi:hypothetical protein
VISVVTVCVCVCVCVYGGAGEAGGGRARQGVSRFTVRGGAWRLCRSVQFCV